MCCSPEEVRELVVGCVQASGMAPMNLPYMFMCSNRNTIWSGERMLHVHGKFEDLNIRAQGSWLCMSGQGMELVVKRGCRKSTR
jgi:hypothetical protein